MPRTLALVLKILRYDILCCGCRVPRLLLDLSMSLRLTKMSTYIRTSQQGYAHSKWIGDHSHVQGKRSHRRPADKRGMPLKCSRGHPQPRTLVFRAA
jgi:hypothetical protein